MRSASQEGFLGGGIPTFFCSDLLNCFLAVQCAHAQADQIQALRHFHGYPLDFFSQPLKGC